MSGLRWGLVIATKDRLDVLKICVSLALGQSCRPVEVVIADASADWKINAEQIARIVSSHPEIRFVYEQGQVPSLTVQRNQAVARSKADIVFMIDDDSFMHPDCAEQIMAIYEADLEHKIAGVQAKETNDVPPGAFERDPNTSPIETPSQAGARKGRLDLSQIRRRSGVVRWVLRNIMMQGKKEVFIPYTGNYPTFELPAWLKGYDVMEEALFGGFRMTFRRQAVLDTPFDDTLRYYCPGEDLDASYRISQTGMLLTARQARLYHHESASGRLNRMQVAHLWSLNQAFLLRRYAPDSDWAWRAYKARMRHRIVSDVIKDGLMRRFSFPQTRGSMRARKDAHQIFAMNKDDINAWYLGAQERIVKT